MIRRPPRSTRRSSDLRLHRRTVVVTLSCEISFSEKGSRSAESSMVNCPICVMIMPFPGCLDEIVGRPARGQRSIVDVALGRLTPCGAQLTTTCELQMLRRRPKSHASTILVARWTYSDMALRTDRKSTRLNSSHLG